MNSADISVYDFPYGYPDFASMKKEVVRIFMEGKYLDEYIDGPPRIRIDGLHSRIPEKIQTNKETGTTNEEPQFFFPISELVQEGKMTLEEVKKGVLLSFQQKAKNAMEEAYIQKADHIQHTFFLAWGIANAVLGKWHLQRVQFDHGEEGGSYYGEKYVNEYGGDNIMGIVDWVVSEISDPGKITKRIEQDREQKKEQSRLLQRNTGKRVFECWCEGCPV